MPHRGKPWSSGSGSTRRCYGASARDARPAGAAGRDGHHVSDRPVRAYECSWRRRGCSRGWGGGVRVVADLGGSARSSCGSGSRSRAGSLRVEQARLVSRAVPTKRWPRGAVVQASRAYATATQASGRSECRSGDDAEVPGLQSISSPSRAVRRQKVCAGVASGRCCVRPHAHQISDYRGCASLMGSGRGVLGLARTTGSGSPSA